MEPMLQQQLDTGPPLPYNVLMRSPAIPQRFIGAKKLASVFTGRSAVRRWLAAAVCRIAAKTRPERILLFGSHARGMPGPNSDIDLLVILGKPRNPEKRYLLVDRAVGAHRWPMDLLVCSHEEIRERLRKGDVFFRYVLRRGIPLYES